jgi:hypothetical protein
LAEVHADLGGVHVLDSLDSGPQASLIYDRNNKLTYSLFTEQRMDVPLSQISPSMVQAVLAAEDQRFYKHHGLDPVRMAGAGHGDFSRLVSDETTVVVEGVGSVIVHPKDTLDATMNGVGAILYTGNPREVNTRMNGLGTIARRDAKDDVDVDDPEAAPVDPQSLQPEYEKPKQKAASDSTEVI